MKPRVLLVDDSKILQSLIRNFAEKAGCEIVACADDGVQGLAAFQKHSPDITFMDITMPNMSGKECLEKIIQLNPQAIVIMLSGLSDPQIEKECLRIGARSFISKSEISDRAVLEKKIAQVLSDFNRGAA